MYNKRIKKNILLLLVLGSLGPALYLTWQQHIATATCVKLPVNLSFCNTPIIDAVIDGRVCSLMFDLGSKFDLTLDGEFLKKINTEQRSFVEWKNWKGTPFEGKSFLIPNVNLSGLLWTNVIASEAIHREKSESLLWNDDPQKYKDDEYMGTVGFPILERTNLCLDLYHRSIYCCKSLKMLQKLKICPNNMVKVRFKIENKHIVVGAETDIGRLDLVLDTGATLSMIKSKSDREVALQKDQRGFSFYQTSHFLLAGKNFGKLKILVFDEFLDCKEIDGLLGMNFLENHIVYIDYPNRCIYVGDCHF